MQLMAAFMTAGRHNSQFRQQGFTYVVMLLALAIFCVGLAAIGKTWSVVAQRDKEDELIQIGDEYESAIADYYNHSPSKVKKYPGSFQDLLQDTRYVGTVRHIRRIYIDPITKNSTWGLIPAPDGGFMGVYSLSTKETLHKTPVMLTDGSFVAGLRYIDWKFVYKSK